VAIGNGRNHAGDLTKLNGDVHDPAELAASAPGENGNQGQPSREFSHHFNPMANA
jgi:hypothetical protein